MDEFTGDGIIACIALPTRSPSSSGGAGQYSGPDQLHQRRRRQLHDRGGLMTRSGTQMDRPAPDLANRRIFITGANGFI